MTTIGSPESHVDLFPDGMIPDIINLVLNTWRKFRKPEQNDKEVPINRRFRESIRKEKNRTDLPFYILGPEFSLSDPQTGKETGRIDIALSDRNNAREEVYFAFECKRLNVTFPSGKKTLANEYVGDDGMMCFVSGKYSAGLASGSMIGYVMDGMVNDAIPSVSNAIEANRVILKLENGTCLEICNHFPKVKSIKQTRHSLARRNFTLYHIFLKV